MLRTVAAHADSLLRTARRFSLCPDDAQDAYQRALEIFMRHADRLDASRAAGWLHVVVKREAQAIRRSRQRLVASHDVDLDAHEARSVPSPEEQLATLELVGRSAEALQRLKPQELRALWLRAQGHSYNEIGALTGWSYTKVNRCLTEGRRSFLARYADIESGAECEVWQPVISAMVDGEATPAQLIELRPHLRNCPGCRATLKALHDSSQPLAAVLPIPLAAVATDGAEHVSSLVTRVFEMIAGGLHDRAATSMMKVQAVAETTAAGKAAAIAGAAAAVAGGGYATVDRTMVERPVERRTVVQKSPQAAKTLPPVTTRIPQSQPQPRTSDMPARTATPVVTEFVRKNGRNQAPEFGRSQTPVGAATAKTSTGQENTVSRSQLASGPAAPEFAASQAAAEFAP
ncbi:MAG: sigma-70 family RNA polymerase sigma factor [Thermoleophilia bacterium]